MSVHGICCHCIHYWIFVCHHLSFNCNSTSLHCYLCVFLCISHQPFANFCITGGRMVILLVRWPEHISYLVWADTYWRHESGGVWLPHWTGQDGIRGCGCKVSKSSKNFGTMDKTQTKPKPFDLTSLLCFNARETSTNHASSLSNLLITIRTLKLLNNKPQNDARSYGIDKICIFAIVLENRYHGGGVPIEPVVNITRTVDLTKTGPPPMDSAYSFTSIQ